MKCQEAHCPYRSAGKRSRRRRTSLRRTSRLSPLGILCLAGWTLGAARPAACAQAPAMPAPAQTPAPAAPADPDTAAGPVAGSVSYSGLVDLYFGINFRAPHPPTVLLTPSGEHIAIDNVGRAFDINDRDPSFSLGEFDITRIEGRGIPFGFTVTLTAGDTARLVHVNEPGGTSNWQTFQQLYVTRSMTLARHEVTFDFGVFNTPFGAEVIESVNNDEYSRGFLFQYGEPLYHAGLRVNITLSDRISLYGAIVNGWNDIADDNNAKSGMVLLTWNPDAHFTGILGYMGGQEGTGAYGVGIAPVNGGYLDTSLVEFIPTLQLNLRLKLGGDLVYGQGAGTVSVSDSGSGVSSTHRSGYWVGMAGYARYQVTPKLAVAGRVEQFEDVGDELRTGAAAHYTKLRSATLTMEYTFFKGRLVSRLEYRHDHASQPFFQGGGVTTPDQDTLSLSGVIKF